ncbi:MAG: hypothetical protein HC906_18810 [Bacteroidales bacterium]|nr:hypothetical protein [Bacteroidales bacterium]
MAEDTIIYELVNLDKYGIGDLLITNLFSFAVPYIRYKIGDRVKILDTPCSCGRQTRIIEKIEGREFEYIELKNGNKYPVTSFFFGNTENILTYQLIYNKKTENLLFRYSLINKEKDIDRDFISELIMKTTELKASFEKADSIEYSKGGKLKKLIVID